MTCNEYVLCDMVYQLATRPGSKIPGWCYMHKKTIAKEIGISKVSVFNLIKKMEERGFLQRDPDAGYLRTTAKWNSVYSDELTPSKESLPGDKKLNSSGKESLPGAGKESLPTDKYSINNSTNNEGTLFPELDEKRETIFAESTVAEFKTFEKQLAKESEAGVDIRYYFAAVSDWCDGLSSRDRRKKKTARGWVATARSFMRSDNEKRKLRMSKSAEPEMNAAMFDYLNT